MKGTEPEEDPMRGYKELFKYQNISDEPYSALCGLISENGPTISLSMAYFMGMVEGKRQERKKKKTHL